MNGIHSLPCTVSSRLYFYYYYKQQLFNHEDIKKVIMTGTVCVGVFVHARSQTFQRYYEGKIFQRDFKKAHTCRDLSSCSQIECVLYPKVSNLHVTPISLFTGNILVPSKMHLGCCRSLFSGVVHGIWCMEYGHLFFSLHCSKTPLILSAANHLFSCVDGLQNKEQFTQND